MWQVVFSMCYIYYDFVRKLDIQEELLIKIFSGNSIFFAQISNFHDILTKFQDKFKVKLIILLKTCYTSEKINNWRSNW